MSKSEKIIFLHLSDIHFSALDHPGGTPIVNVDIRNQLLHDLAEVAAKTGSPHHILVSGDLTYSGSSDEYEKAGIWLKDICDKVGCDREALRIVCGNHDVQRTATRNSQAIKDFQHNLHTKEVRELNDYVDSFVRDEFSGGAAFGSIANYNSFAENFQGHFNAKRPFWQHTIVLNDTSRLLLRGLNSTLASNEFDHFEKQKMVLGYGYSVMLVEEGLEHLSMCHHPPDWLRDKADVERYLDSRARIQIYGHLHKPQIEELGRKEFRFVRLHAGAVNPEEPNGPLKPAYNWFTLTTCGAAGSRRFVIEVFPRIWDEEATRFRADNALTRGGESKIIELPLPDFNLAPDLARQILTAAVATEPLPTLSDPLDIVTSSDKNVERMVALRRFAFSFLNMPYNAQVAIATTLGLLQPEDRSVLPSELFRRLYERAKQKGITAQFWDLVNKQQTVPSREANPFQ